MLVTSCVLSPFCQCWASFVEGALTLRPKLTREKMHVNVKDVLRSQLCRACETMLLCFWSQSLQRAVALAFLVGLLSVHLSWITDLLRELLRRCQKQAAVLETSMLLLRRYKPHPPAAWSSSISCSFPGLLHVSAVPSWDLELILRFPPKRPPSKSALLGEIPCPAGGIWKLCSRCARMPFGLKSLVLLLFSSEVYKMRLAG